MKNKKLVLIPTFLLALNCVGCDNHEHSFAIDKYDENGHWKECECGERETIVAHTLVDKYDATNHWKECVCGYATPKLTHTLEQKKNDTQHWQECSGCAYVSEKVNHSLNNKVNDNNHWKECDCGFSTTKVDHTLEDKYDNAQHWQECSDCAYETTRVNHEFENQDDFYSHWRGCKNCEYDGEKSIHDYQIKSDDSKHWRECSCGKKVEEDTHTFTMKHDSENHWQECACGYKKEISNHRFGELAVDEQATCQQGQKGHYVCLDCGEVKNVVGELSTHEYESEELRAVSTTVCGLTRYTCKYCTDSYEETTPHTGEHIFFSEYISVNDTQHARKCTCTGCNVYEEKALSNHIYSKTVVDREPDGNNPGREHVECQSCGHTDPNSIREFTGSAVTNIELTKVLPVVGEAINSEVTCLTEGVVVYNDKNSILYSPDGGLSVRITEGKVLTSEDVGKTYSFHFSILPAENRYFRIDETTGAPIVTCTLNGKPVTCPQAYYNKSNNYQYWGFAYDYTIPECVHDWQLTNEIAPTDSSMGENTYVCNKCGNEKKEPVAHTGEHKYIKKQYSATKHNTGCSIDGCTYTGDWSSATECNYRLEVDKAPDGENKGVIRHVCRVCKGIKNYEPEEVDVIYIDSFDLENFTFVKKNQLATNFSYDFNPGMIDVLSNKLYVNNAEVKSGQTVSEGTKLCWKTYFKCKEGFAISPSLIDKSLDMYVYSNELCRYKLVITQTTYEGQDCYLINPTFTVGMPVRP